METKGVIKKLEKNKVTVLAYKESACAGCNKCTPKQKFSGEYTFDTTESFCLDEIVCLEIENIELFKAGFLIYIIPILFFFFGYTLSYKIFQNQNLSIIFSFIFLFLALGLLAIFDKLHTNKKQSSKIIVKKINE